MLEQLITPAADGAWAAAVLVSLAALLGVECAWVWRRWGLGAPPPQGAPVNPMCPRLEAQLATIDRGGGSGDPAKEEQIRRYQDAQAKQQGELDRVTSQAKRMGCDSSGFFSLFSGQSAQCGPVNNQIQQMRANLDQITTSLERLRGGGFGGAERDNQRRSVLTALAQNNCGPQYANAAAAAIFSTICSATTIPARPAPISVRNPAPSAPSASAPATAPIFRSRSPPYRPAFPTTRRPARRFARRRKPPCSLIAIPART